MRRRAVLAAIGAGLGGLSGCSVLPGGGAGERTAFGVPELTARDPTPTTVRTTRATPGTTTARPEDDAVAYAVKVTDEPAFEPASLRVEPRDWVLWLNTGSAGHTVTARSIPAGAEYFASGDFPDERTAREAYPEGTIDAGDFYGHRFDVPGRYDYVCIPHEGAGMTGRICVGDDERGR